MFTEENFLRLSFASVAVTIPVNPKGILIYRIPEALRPRLVAGMRVLVPVGRRRITGIVTSLSPVGDLPAYEKVKDILDIIDEDLVFPADLLHLWQWASNYYSSAPGEMLSTILPEGLRSESTWVVKLKKNSGTLTPASSLPNRGAGDEPGELHGKTRSLDLTTVEQKILSLVTEKKSVTLKALRRNFPSLAVGRVVQKLATRGILEVNEHLRQRKQVPSTLGTVELSSSDEKSPSFVLSAAQEHAYTQVAGALQKSAFQVFLLQGITGSGKTEVYLRTTQDALGRGHSVLILVPEIGLTQQLIKQVRQRFGACVAVLHSGMVASERWKEWRRVARGDIMVVVGVRSAVFAPLSRLGLIVVDEEHDTAYKQEEGVRYNARDLALVRAKIVSCPVLLGSATPSLESYAHSRAHRYTLIELPERVESRRLPGVEIVDLRQEKRNPRADKIFSSVLREALITNHHAGKQSLLFLNRRGYASYLQCRLCGNVLSCSRCSVTLTFHLQGRVLRCHYCGFSRQAPASCPQCHELALEGSGVGTEQVEQALKSFLPQARVARLDRDSVSRRGVLERVLKEWSAHAIDVLIGTQMIAKGHDVPNVTVVGVLLADLSLNLPDFRAAERTFQLLTQVAGRAGRGQEAGRVIIQTYLPHHYSIRFAARQDFRRFAVHELRYRKRLGYPPFTRLVNIRSVGKEGAKVQAVAERLALRLQTGAQGITQTLEILGPAPAPIERLKERERWQILLKDVNRCALHALVKNAQEEIHAMSHAEDVHTIIDVDPYNML